MTGESKTEAPDGARAEGPVEVREDVQKEARDAGETARRRGRPRKGDASRNATRAVLIRAGVELLTEKGFSATGLDEILKRVGVPKGSFYHYFASKEAFGAVLIEAYGASFAARLDRYFLDETEAPLARLDNFVASARRNMARHGYRRGCLIGNLGQEMSALPEGFRSLLSEVFTDWQQRTAACLNAAQAAGEVSADIDSAELASFFWIGWEGAVLRAKLERSAAPLDQFYNGFLKLARR